MEGLADPKFILVCMTTTPNSQSNKEQAYLQQQEG